ncbi:MAG: DUF3365 domain-containing protein [Methylococcales bacterium]|nr:DUF3365 domain-containing protein [Methylococcales bacterium]
MQTKFFSRKVLSFFILFVLSSMASGVNARVIPYQGSTKNTINKAATKTTKEDIAIKRTREQIRMLDDLYKTAVVLITEHYVTDPSILSAASAAKALFAAMKKNGWHDVRLVGLTDILNNPSENAPRDAFEKQAKKRLLAGESSHEEVISKNGKRFLRMATPVPVVMKKCIMCHANFEGNNGNIGTLSYIVPVIE